MRKTTLIVAALAVAVAAVPAAAGERVKTKPFITNALDAGGGRVQLLGGLSSPNDTCLSRRKVIVFDAAGDDKLGSTKAKRGSWELTTGDVGLGDTVYAKVKRRVFDTDDGRLVCKGGKSKQFEIGD